MSSSLPLALNLSLPHKFHYLLQPLLPFYALLKPSSPPLRYKSLICHCSNPSQSDREEARWLREEQRWLREEQRWVRERDLLLFQISALNLQIKALERRILTQEGSPSLSSSSSSSISDAIANVSALLQVLKDKSNNLIMENGSSLQQLVLEEKSEEEAVIEKKVIIEEAARVLHANEGKTMESRTTLRKGSEGDEVREMQEALLKLGFYSGEEDVEYSSFSSGTEGAVKTWQATLGAQEDGIMTAELLERLYMDIKIKGTGNLDEKEKSTVSPKDGTNGAAVASMTKISEVRQKVVEKGDKEVSHQRVFLLGENRWEEPSRLVSSNRVDKSMNNDATTKCLQCRGEGRLLCTECDGTGKPNIEPQFLEWVDEGSKCPYCEGLGYTTCDVCEGKALV